MVVATGTAEIDATQTLCSVKGTMAEVISELATGTAITANWRCLNVDETLNNLAGSGATWAVIYTVPHP